MDSPTSFGALVISLDFELHWGMRDICGPDHPYMLRIAQARQVIPRLLDLFEEYEISATWATVGFLFAHTRQELAFYAPDLRPHYTNPRLDPYQESVGFGEWDDPFHFAPHLIKEIQRRPGQEIATHTFSHYYCLEPGQSAETFEADLQSAISIARNMGVELRSIVFPRNQHNPAYDALLLKHGITCYRGNEQHAWYQSGKHYHSRRARLGRLLDTYWNLCGNHLRDWEDLYTDSGLCNISSSRFFRPYSPLFSMWENRKIARIRAAIREAAQTSQIVHLWWHPHNFAAYNEENFRGLRSVLDEFVQCRDQYGMKSLSMQEVARVARQCPGSSRKGDCRAYGTGY